MTTGATLAEAARTLVRAGAQQVECWVVARTLRDGRRVSGAAAPGPAPAFSVVLVHPEIPPNTGNVIRLTANTATELHLVEPLGFRMDDRELKRAGLDYHEYARVVVHSRLRRVSQRARRAAGAALVGVHDRCGRIRSTTRGSLPGDVLVFGCETRGLPSDVHRGIRAGRAAAHPDACGRAQPQPFECGRDRRLRSVAPDRVRRRRMTPRQAEGGPAKDRLRRVSRLRAAARA